MFQTSNRSQIHVFVSEEVYSVLQTLCHSKFSQECLSSSIKDSRHILASVKNAFTLTNECDWQQSFPYVMFCI